MEHPFQLQPTPRAFDVLVMRLRREGHIVEAENILGLWRVNNGPELTEGQLFQVAHLLLGAHQCP